MYVGFGNVCDAEVVLFCNFKIYIYIPLRIYYDCLTRSLTAYQVTALRQAFVINVFKKPSPLFLRIDYSVDTANFRYFFLLYSYFSHTRMILFLPNCTLPMSSNCFKSRDTTVRAVPSSLANCSWVMFKI